MAGRSLVNQGGVVATAIAGVAAGIVAFDVLSRLSYSWIRDAGFLGFGFIAVVSGIMILCASLWPRVGLTMGLTFLLLIVVGQLLGDWWSYAFPESQYFPGTRWIVHGAHSPIVGAVCLGLLAVWVASRVRARR